MEELEYFKKTIASNIDRAYSGGVVLLPFIDETKQRIIKNMIPRNCGIEAVFEGGFENPDYERCAICPEDYDVNMKVKVFEIIYSRKYLTPNHRMILGTLMSLGIKRDSIGDIYIDDAGCAYFACTEEISPYLLENFKTLGKVSIELVEPRELVTKIIKTKKETKFVASLRLDVILAAAYNLSRKEAEEMIVSGLVFVNHMPTSNVSMQLKCADLLSVRHKGRVSISNIGGTTKSNRIILELAYQV